MRFVHRYISKQLRRPRGAFGRVVMTRLLDFGNRRLIQATLAGLELHPNSSYLDVGFGGGVALRLAARIVPDGALFGIDYAPDVIRQGQRRLRKLLATGRLTLAQADIREMPFGDGLMDCISSINTVYFWSEPSVAASELLRLLVPGGRVAIGYTGAEKMARYGQLTEGFTLYRPEAVEALLVEAGFAEVQTEALQGLTQGDFVTVGRRPVG